MHRYVLIALTCLSAFWVTTAAAELSIEGPCTQGHRWTATMINQGGGGIASYNACAPRSDMAYFRCGPGNGPVEFTIEDAFRGLAAQDHMTADVMIDGRAYPISGTILYSEMMGSGFPRFTINRTDAVFAALQQGSQASVTMAGTTFTMHLSGSGDMLSAMFEACP